MHKHIAAGLAAAVVFTGLVAAPAQALTTSTPTATSTAGSSETKAIPSSPDPVVSSPSSAATLSPTAAPSPTANSKPSPVPTPAPSQRVAPQDNTPVEEPVKVLQSTIASGDLTGVARNSPKYSWVSISGNVSIGAEGLSRQYRVEVLDPKTKIWSTYLSGWTLTNGTWYNYIDATKEDTQTFRLVVDADDSYDKYTGPATVFKRTKLSMVLTNMSNTKEGSTFVTVPWEQKKFDVFLSRAVSGLTLELQNLRGKKWVTTSKLTTKSGINSYSFDLPKGNSKSKNTTQSYRAIFAATVDYEGSTSATTNYRWENPYLYTGTQKTAYNYTAKYCPTVMIKMDSSLEKKGRWGQAHLGGNQKIFSLYTKTPAKHLKTVALHECSHFYQWDTANNANNKSAGGWNAYNSAANKLMGTKNEIGIERVNECMSDTWNKHSYWSYGATAKICAQPKVKDFVQKSLKGQKVI